MKKVLFALLVPAMMVLFFACKGGNDAAKYVGEWNMVSMSEGDQTINAEDLAALGMTMTLSLKDDNTMVMTMAGESQEGTWKVDGGKCVLTADGEDVSATLEDGQLVLAEENMKMTFAK